MNPMTIATIAIKGVDSFMQWLQNREGYFFVAGFLNELFSYFLPLNIFLEKSTRPLEAYKYCKRFRVRITSPPPSVWRRSF